MLLAAGTASCWTQERRHRAGWWSRRFARDVRRRMRTCITEFGNAEPTQVRSLTRHSISLKKATQAKDSVEFFWLRGLVPRSWTLQVAKLEFWRQFGSGVLTEACTYIFGDGSGTHSDPRIRRVGWFAVVIQGVPNCRANPECWKLHSERLMNSLKPTGGWARSARANPTPWAGRSSWRAWWQLRAREVTWSASHITISSRTDRTVVGPHHDLGKVATLTSGGECFEP